MTDSARDLLGGHLFGTLTPEEEKTLLAASLDDQELFDALVDDEPVRELLADRAVRRELLEVLERPTAWERVRSFFRRPPTWVDLTVAAAAVLAAVVLVRTSWQPAPRGAASPTAAAYRQLFSLSPRVTTPARLEVVEQPQADLPGLLSIEVDADSAVLVLEREADGSIVPLFPPTAREAVVHAGQRLRVSTSAAALPLVVRLAVFPPDVDPLSLDPGALRALESRLTLVEREIAAGGTHR
jgi:hypothetical protein